MREERTNLQHGPALGVEGGGSIGRGACPMCQTVMNSATDATTAAWWRCNGCGQAWTARRLLVVAAYAQYITAQVALAAGRPGVTP